MLPSLNLRLVWFVQGTQAGQARELFSDLFGTEPDRSTQVKNTTPQSPFYETAGGTIGNFDAEVQRQGARIDLVIQKTLASSSNPFGAPPLMNTEEAINFLTGVVNQAKRLPVSRRVSLIVVVNSITETLDKAKSKFCDFTGFKLDLSNTSDHFFQINRRFEALNMQMNRVIQLSVTEGQSIQFSIVSGAQSAQSVKTIPLLSITYDFNTVPNPNDAPYSLDLQKQIISRIADEHIRAISAENLEFLKG
ncbi:hypothetical protein [Paracoccus onubensis]|uniref:hypothetical protein n=1 Tax=Paracoccus onubensis TaxID=1675788 RepID=UPI0011C3DE46|nr:hypothetical protein [Paracoccus onubensis]